MNEHRPAKWMEKLLKRILPRYTGETAIGDFEEEYRMRSERSGKTSADIFYLRQILKSLFPFLFESIRFAGVMALNYIKIGLRDIRRNPLYSLISVFGLGVGMAGCIIVMIFVFHELSFDRFHANSGRIYRLTFEYQRDGRTRHDDLGRYNTAPLLLQEFPGIEQAVRLVQHNWFVVTSEEKKFFTDPMYADPSIFQIFTFPLIRGDRSTCLSDPDCVVISQSLAEKFFGQADPMGRVITLYSQTSPYDFRVTGIMGNIPSNSQLQFEFLAPLQHLESRKDFNPSGRNLCSTYLLLDSAVLPGHLEEKLPEFARRNFGDQHADAITYHLQPLTSIHLYSGLNYEYVGNENPGSPEISYYLAAVALIILLIAVVNFMNLATARAAHRKREVGIRKTVGAGRFRLFRQFLFEALGLTVLALIIAVILARVLLPVFNRIMGQALSFNSALNAQIMIGLPLLALLTAVLSSSYPAFVLSSFRPVEVMQGGIRRGGRLGFAARKGLVIFQFSLSLVFILTTLVIYRQLNFVRNKDLGFNNDHVIEIPIFKDDALERKADLIRRELSDHPNIVDVIVSAGTAGSYIGWPTPCVPEDRSEEEPVELFVHRVGEGFNRFFKIDVIQGRDFSREILTDAKSALIINQKAAEVLGWADPIGKRIKSRRFDDQVEVVVGVVRDYHNGPLHEEIKPSVYIFEPEANQTIFIRIRPDNIPQTLAFLENKWKELPTHLIFYYNFMDDSLNQFSYRNDIKAAQIFAFSAVTAVVLACLGMFGLAAYTAERRRKEIGIRKVLGASTPGIIKLLSGEFTRLALFANLIGWPVGYLVSRRWLQNFAYRTGIELWIFPAAAGLVLTVTLLTVSVQSIRAASANPADTLRYE